MDEAFGGYGALYFGLAPTTTEEKKPIGKTAAEESDREMMEGVEGEEEVKMVENLGGDNSVEMAGGEFII